MCKTIAAPDCASIRTVRFRSAQFLQIVRGSDAAIFAA
jgi:hypothetical protein